MLRRAVAEDGIAGGRHGSFFIIADAAAFLARRVAEGELAIADPALAAAQFVDLSQSTLMRPRLFNAERMPPSEDEIAYVVGEAVTTFMARYGVKAA